MKLDLIEIALLAAASQGIFLSIIIYFQSRHQFANRILSLAIFLYSFIIFDMFLNDIGFYISFPHVRLFTSGISFLAIPIFFLYVYYLTHSLAKLRKRDWLHFIPFALATGCFALFFYSTESGYHLLMQKMQQGEDVLFFSIFNWAVLIQIFIYLFLSIIFLVRFEKKIKLIFSDTNKLQLHWLRNIFFFLLLMAIIFLFDNIIAISGDAVFYEYRLSSGFSVISVYAMGYLALFKSGIFYQEKISKSIHSLDRMAIASRTETNPSNSKKYVKSEISPDVATRLLEALEHIMQKQKPYLVSDLTLTQLADMLDTSPHNLSQILNAYLHKNFYEYINAYRIEEAKEKLSSPETRHMNILAIAFDAGFNSKSSFNTIFKNYVGQTPSQYRNNTLN